MAFENEGIRVEAVRTCYFCRRPGRELYSGLRDGFFSVPGVWSLWRCAECSLLWLNPQPLREDLGKIYEEYYTHEPEPVPAHPTPRRIPWREKAKLSVLAAEYGYPNPFGTPFLNVVGKLGRFVPLLSLTHVIEHVHDPVDLLRECGRVLRPGGRMMVETPNAESSGHRLFGIAWHGLDAPRHLYLFSPTSLLVCAQKAGLQITDHQPRGPLNL